MGLRGSEQGVGILNDMDVRNSGEENPDEMEVESFRGRIDGGRLKNGREETQISRNIWYWLKNEFILDSEF